MGMVGRNTVVVLKGGGCVFLSTWGGAVGELSHFVEPGVVVCVPTAVCPSS